MANLSERLGREARIRSVRPGRMASAGAPSVAVYVHQEDAAGMGAALRRQPLNATHLFWREPVADLGFPFVKTDLLLRNPLGVADPMLWRDLLPDDAEAVAAIEEHLAILGGRAPVD